MSVLELFTNGAREVFYLGQNTQEKPNTRKQSKSYRRESSLNLNF